jgi:hypothetical protein
LANGIYCSSLRLHLLEAGIHHRPGTFRFDTCSLREVPAFQFRGRHSRADAAKEIESGSTGCLLGSSLLSATLKGSSKYQAAYVIIDGLGAARSR